MTIIYEVDPSGWWVAAIPEVPGAFSQGKTKEESRSNVIDALNELMRARREIALSERPSNAEVEDLPLAG